MSLPPVLSTNMDGLPAAAQHHLLTDALFSVVEEERRSLTLPGVLARLLADNAIRGFPELSASQRSHHWRFLVRCAAKALAELGRSADQVSGAHTDALEGELRDVLMALLPGGGWRLWEPDPRNPAFLQPPTPDGHPPSESYKELTVAALTIALGKKNHDRKAEKGRELSPERTVYALLAYQGGGDLRRKRQLRHSAQWV